LTQSSESSLARARRELSQTVTGTIYGLAFTGLCGAVSTTISAVYLTSGHARIVQVAIGVAAFFVGIAVALAASFVALWATAPTRQRDEARAALRRTLAFPNLEVAISSSLYEDDDPEGRIDRITLPARITNREEAKAVSLSFQAAVLDSDGNHLGGFGQGDVEPWAIAPMSSETRRLVFRVPKSYHAEWSEKTGTTHWFMNPYCRLIVIDHVSGQSKELPFVGGALSTTRDYF